MAKTRFIQNSFTSGVLSPLLKGRTDLEQYYQGLEVCKDFVLLPQGGMRRRPGTKFIAKLPITSNVKLKDFSVSSDRHYLLAFIDLDLKIYRKSTDVEVATLTLPYLSAEVSALRDTQSETVMLVTHEEHAPRRIINGGDDVTWTTDIPAISNVPQFDYNDVSSPTPTNDVQVMTFAAFVPGDTFQIDIEGVLSKNITFAGDSTAAERTSTAFNIQKNIQDMPVVGDTGVAVARTGALAYTITISGESTKPFELFSAFATSGTGSKTITVTHTTTGIARKENVWSAGRGWPITTCFYEGRLVFGGTKSKAQSIFFSKAGIAFNFDIGEGDADEAIFVTISSRKLNDIVDVFPGRNLQIFTAGSEFTVNVSPITPETITITPQTSHGSLNLEAKEIDGATIFADRNGKSIKEYLFSFQEDAYTTNDASVLSPELIKSPVDIDILGGTASDDANWVFIVNSDGSATVLNTLRAQDINGFTEWTTSGAIKDVAVVDDELYMVNRRTIDGTEFFFIEKWSFDHLLDNSVKVVNAGSTTVSGFDHLDGETVRVVADGSVLPDRLVTAGDITLTAAESVHVNIEVGIGFVPSFKPMPMNTNVGSGQNAMRIKKLIRMNMRVLGTFGMSVDGENIPSRFFAEASESPLDTPPEEKTGIIGDVFNTIGWKRDDMPLFELPDPTPATILSIGYEVESS